MKAFKTIMILVLSGIFLHSCEEGSIFDDPRDNITGKWLVNEESSVFKKSTDGDIYEVNITKHPTDSSAVYVGNFYNLGKGSEVKVFLEDLNLSIPVQNVAGYTILGGNGYVTSNYKKISLSYNVDLGLGGEGDDVQAEYSRPEK